MTRHRHDVVVIGAGPAGLVAALRLAEEGLDVLVLEEDAAVGYPTHCTGLISDEVQTIVKVPDHVVLQRPERCIMVAPRGHAAELRSPGEVITVIDRGAFDQALAAGVERAGATVLTDQRVDTLHAGPRDVAVDIGGGTGRFHARAVVLACGVTYRFHHLLSCRPPEAVLHTAQLEMDALPAEALEIHLGREVAPEGFAWLVPVHRPSGSRLKAGVLLRGDARAHLARFLARPAMAARLREAPGDPVRRLLPVRPVRRSYGPRMLAVGDAAGLTKPVTGGGIFYSLLSGVLAAETLVEALAADDLGMSRLARYETRWRQRLGPEIRTATWFRRVIAHLEDGDLDRFVRALASDDVQGVIARAARFNWHRGVILALLRQPGVKSILLRSLFR